MNIQEIIANGNYHLLDVREELELEMDGSISTAINIPLGEIEDRIDEIEALEGDILVYCRSGNRSGKAVSFFESHGLKNTYNAGGYKDIKDLL